jgi:hypothetical protein
MTGVAVGVGVSLGVGVIVGVSVMVGLSVMVGVREGVEVAVSVGEGVALGVREGVVVALGVIVLVGVGLGVGRLAQYKPPPNPSASSRTEIGIWNSSQRRMAFILIEVTPARKSVLCAGVVISF